MLETTLFTFLHLLVLVYWLGGDLGAFYASFVLTDEARPAGQRLGAAVVVKHVDMAPRMALIFAAPTGLALAVSRGWLALDWGWILAAFALAVIWAGIAWRIHLGAGPAWAKSDLAIRIGLMIALALTGLAGLAAPIDLPGFLSWKLLILAAAIALGLAVRRLLKPFSAAMPGLASGAPSEADNAAIRGSLRQVRLAVVALWGLIVAAAILGISAS
ncbi:hypothetical protein E5163_03335 [Marinicauda algicola]|uniref:DUF2269 family protein n=2 Tax=Marinicauda algicola TaxID=2029849 RepID=A0A4S2H454_9PROT|nr:hypothetical protein [Marinicauda algicola]TGY90171.1 hypothetical protein E5163_03335 [Marinicauda algicola]